MFDPSSRYHHIPTRTHVATDGREHEYKLRRFLPIAPSGSPPVEIKLQAHDRLDLLAARLLGQPQMFWRLCDVNTSLDPFALTGATQAGRALRVPTSHT